MISFIGTYRAFLVEDLYTAKKRYWTLSLLEYYDGDLFSALNIFRVCIARFLFSCGNSWYAYFSFCFNNKDFNECKSSITTTLFKLKRLPERYMFVSSKALAKKEWGIWLVFPPFHHDCCWSKLVSADPDRKAKTSADMQLRFLPYHSTFLSLNGTVSLPTRGDIILDFDI
jgi:hypothetical protein